MSMNVPGPTVTAEEWRPIPGLDGWQDVSNIGRVRTWRSTGTYRDIRLPEPRVLAGCVTRGYLTVAYRIPGGARQLRPVHTLVLLAFRGPRPEGHLGAHLDGNPLNNRVENLAWVTPLENQHHRRYHGTWQEGEAASGATKLTAVDVRRIRELAESGRSFYSLAKEFGVGKSHVANIVYRRVWASVA